MFFLKISSSSSTKQQWPLRSKYFSLSHYKIGPSLWKGDRGQILHMLSFLKTVLFRDSLVSNPLSTNRESYHSNKHLLETRKREPHTAVAAEACKRSEREQRREKRLLAEGARHAGVTNLCFKVQHLAWDAWSDRLMIHRSENNSQFLWCLRF